MESLRKKVVTGLAGCRHRLDAGLLVRPSALRNWNAHQHARSGFIGFKAHSALELPQPFSHAANSYARALRLNFRQLRRRMPLPWSRTLTLSTSSSRVIRITAVLLPECR